MDRRRIAVDAVFRTLDREDAFASLMEAGYSSVSFLRTLRDISAEYFILLHEVITKVSIFEELKPDLEKAGKFHYLTVNEAYNIISDGLEYLDNWVSIVERRQFNEEILLNKAACLAYVNINVRLLECISSVRLLSQHGLMRSSIPIVRKILELGIMFEYFLDNPEQAEPWWMEDKSFKVGKIMKSLKYNNYLGKMYGFLSINTHANAEKDSSLTFTEDISDTIKVLYYKVISFDNERIKAYAALIGEVLKNILLACESKQLISNFNPNQFYSDLDSYIYNWLMDNPDENIDDLLKNV